MRFSMAFHTAVAALSSCSMLVLAESIYKPVRPPAIPLAVRSPYLNVWLQGGINDCGPTLPGSWPRFWTSQIQGWQGFIRVDGVPYNWMGGSPAASLAEQVAFEYTSTKSIFTINIAGKVTLTATFFSPVYEDDLARQSQQFSYITVEAESADGQPHSTQIYMDISAEFASGALNQTIMWLYDRAFDVAYHQIFRGGQRTPPANSNRAAWESGEIASWGNWFFSTGARTGLTFRNGASDNSTRSIFLQTGKLDNITDENFRAVNNDWPVFAFAQDFGNLTNQSVSMLFTLGLVQDEVVSFAGSQPGMTTLPGLWSDFFQSDVEAMTVFYNDFAHAVEAGAALDKRIYDDSVAVAGPDYAAITTLSVRQTFGGLQFAGTQEKPYIFLKEISSNSDIQTVDVIFPAYPILLYLNARLAKYLLDPLFENQEAGRYPNKFAIHDLGTFPVAKGYPAGNDESMPLEECGNMIIMSLAYAHRSGDAAYLTQHYPLLEQWAQFLIDSSLMPENQLSTDDFAGRLPNQVNLALKGIIGLRAMSEIAKITENEDKYGSVAEQYLTEWKKMAINTDANPPHTMLSYGDKDSHGLLYNLYADKLLGLNFIDQEIYDMQSEFYLTIATKYGVPLDTRHTWVKSDWEMFAAAVASNETRDMFIKTLVRWIKETRTNRAMTDIFEANTGTFPVGGPLFTARPVVGGHFALLAFNSE